AAVAGVLMLRMLLAWFDTGSGLDTMSVADARRVAEALVARGWTWPKALRSVQTPDRNLLRALSAQLPPGPDVDDPADAIVLRVPHAPRCRIHCRPTGSSCVTRGATSSSSRSPRCGSTGAQCVSAWAARGRMCVNRAAGYRRRRDR